jgi:hypothetical protein
MFQRRRRKDKERVNNPPHFHYHHLLKLILIPGNPVTYAMGWPVNVSKFGGGLGFAWKEERIEADCDRCALIS